MTRADELLALAEALDFAGEWLDGAMGHVTADYGEVTGTSFQMMTMCPQPVELAAKFAALKPAAAALRALAAIETGAAA